MQTIWGTAGARFHRVAFIRERIATADGDFVDLDWTAPGLFADRTADNRKIDPDPALAHTAARRWMEPLDLHSLNNTQGSSALVLFHGLEGSSHSRYAQSIAHYFRARGWIVVVAHFRGCSGFPNRMARAYYSGDIDEISFILSKLKDKIPNAKWHAAGVSLGANALVKCLGDYAASTRWLHACAAISAPLDLVAAGDALSRTLIGRHFYSRYFLKSMVAKIREKARRFPGTIDILKLDKVKTIRDFDDLYTAPMHGYRNALDYWTRASAKPVLKSVDTPTIILNARNDPFIPEASLPGTNDCSDAILLHQPAQGGHVGFVTGAFPGNLNWLPKRMANYFERLT
jgi:predicted alpha/beta-fold hydrolase